MADEERREDEDLPGLEIETFRRYVDSIVGLRDEGKLLVFLTPVGNVRIVYDAVDMEDALGLGSGEEVDAQAMESAVSEVSTSCALCLTFGTPDRVADFIVENIYDRGGGSRTKTAKKRLREREQAKVELVQEHLVTDSLRKRIRRLRTSTVACLADLDAEVVQERRDETERTHVDEPFLRLRFRHVDRDRSSFPWWIGQFILRGEPFGSPSRSFELECDESDIDLLLLRLIAAKRMLQARKDRLGQQRSEGQ